MAVIADDVETFVRQDVADGIFATAAQMYISVAGQVVLDFAAGVDAVGAAVDVASLFAVYCAGKPALAAAVGCLVDDGELSLNDRLGHILDADGLPDNLGPLTITQLLSHTAGLHGLLAPAIVANPQRLHRSLVRDWGPPPVWVTGKTPAYSEISAWHLLAECVEAIAGMTSQEFVRSRVLDPLGVTTADFFSGGMTDAAYDEHRSRFAINCQVDGNTLTPMLMERTRRFRCLPSPAIATTATMRGIGAFYEGLLGDLSGARLALEPETVADLVQTVSHGDDLAMGRRCGYGHGFMTNLSEHEFGRYCSEFSFGHSGFRGVTVGFCDPRHDLVVAYHFNGVIDTATGVEFRRPVVVEMIYRMLGLGTGPSTVVLSEGRSLPSSPGTHPR